MLHLSIFFEMQFLQCIRLDVESGESTLFQESKAPFDRSEYESKQVFYTSKDGTQVPMIISYKKGIALDGSAPTMLYGYGGFSANMRPNFSSSVATWVRAGGVYALAILRGGAQHGVAHGVAMGFVHGLETVDVEHRDAEALPAADAALVLLLHQHEVEIALLLKS